MNFTDPAFIVALSTLAFVLLAGGPIVRMISRGLDTRGEGIRKDIDQASALKKEAEKLLDTYKKRNKKAAQEAEAILANAKEEAERILTGARKKAEEDLARRTELALQKIAQAEAGAVRDIRDNAVDITISAARQLITENMTRESAERLVTNAIGDLNRKFH